jgi:RNA polymerase-associated protein RTF1
VENNPNGGDPFSRFKTNTRVFYQDVVQEENKKALVDAQMSYHERMDEKSKNEAKMETSTYRVLGVMDQLIKLVDVDLGVVTSI